jgi:hypothetical protein
MDQTLATALHLFLVTIAPHVADPAMEKAAEKVADAVTRVAQGEITPMEASSYIRDVVTVLS